MNPIRNPYRPGGGLSPPLLAGRASLRERVRVDVARLRAGRSTKSVLMIGLHGVGKTVLLEQMCRDMEAEGVYTLSIQAPYRHSLPALLLPQLRLVLRRLREVAAAQASAERALSVVARLSSLWEGAFMERLQKLDFEREALALAEQDYEARDPLTLLERAGAVAKLADAAVLLFIDDFHCLNAAQLCDLVAVLHRCAQSRSPIMVVGAGLPQLRARVGNAKAYAERLFDFPAISLLSEFEAALAIVQPAMEEGVVYEVEAVTRIVEQTRGYPFFLQALAYYAWDGASTNTISWIDVERAGESTISALDEHFFRAHFDRLLPTEKRYLQAMADLGPGPHRSGTIADRLVRKVQAVAPVRNGLISKGVIWSPGHGDTAFTVPFFDEFLKRILPNERGQDA